WIAITARTRERALGRDPRPWEAPEFYDRLTRARREASSRPLSVVTETFQLFQNAITLAGYVALLVRWSGLAVIGLVAAPVPATLVKVKYSTAPFRLRNWRSPESRRVNYLEYGLAHDHDATEVKLCGVGPVLLDRFKELGEMFYAEDRLLAARRAGSAFSLSLLATGAFYAAYAAMAIEAARGALSLGDLVLYVAA